MVYCQPDKVRIVNNISMKQIFKVHETREFYETPEIEFLDLEAEGIICGSGDGTIDDWEDDGDPIDF